MPAVTRFVLRHRLVVLLAWLALAVAGAATAGTTGERLTFTFDLPGSASDDGGRRLAESFGIDDDTPDVVLVTAAVPLSDPQARASLDRLARTARSAGSSLVGGSPAGDGAAGPLLGDDGRSAVLLLLPPAGPPEAATAAAERVVAAVRAEAPAGWQVRMTGFRALEGAGAPSGPGVLVETVIGGLGALVVLAVVFASPVALLPLLTAAVSILTTFLLLLGLTELTEVNVVAQFIIGLIGLGVAIDYALLVVTRWREERALGAGNREAVVAANRTAGRAVVLSGVTVTIGLLALVLLPMPAMRSFGYAGALIPLVSVLVSITLVPAVLDAAGPALDRFRLRRGSGTAASAGWQRWARLVLRRRWWAIAAGVGVLALLAVPGLGLQPGNTRATALATSGPAREGLDALIDAGLPTGVLTPLHVVTTPDAAASVTARLAALPGVHGVLPLTSPEPSAGRPPAGSPSGTSGSPSGSSGTVDLVVLPDAETGSGPGQDTTRRVREAVGGDPAVRAVAGQGTGDADFLDTVYGSFPLLLTVVCALTFVLLTRAFRSPLLAAKAVLLNLVSLTAAFGVIVLVWQRGLGSDLLWQTPGTGSIAAWVPIIVFSFLFGLSMDYEVFLLARMREARDGGASTDDAVVEGLSRTGPLVTSAALILFLAFVAMSSAPATDVRVLATGLGAGILLDATAVRCLLVPTLVSVLGRGNWWMPDPLARLLLLRPAAVVPTPAPSGSPSGRS